MLSCLGGVEKSRQASRRLSIATSREVEVRKCGRSSRTHMIGLKVLEVLKVLKVLKLPAALLNVVMD